MGQDDTDLPPSEISLVERFRDVMSLAAESSLILKPLSLLSRLYDEQSPDARPSADIDQTEVSCVTSIRDNYFSLTTNVACFRDVIVLQRSCALGVSTCSVQGGVAWSSVVKQVGMMDNLLRACFAPQAADVAEAPTLSAEQAALQASTACEARIARAHAGHSAKSLAASAFKVLSQLVRSLASAQPVSQVGDEQHSKSADPSVEGLSNLEASPGLEAADEQLNRLGQAGSQAGSFDAGDESWLEDEAQLQSSQEYTGEQILYAGEQGQLSDGSRPVSVQGGLSEQQELQQHSFLDFDEDPAAGVAATAQSQAAQMDLQLPAPEENAHEQLPAYFGGADEDSMALEGLLENGSVNPIDGILDSLEPDSLHGDSSGAQHDDNLPSFFQPDEGTGLLDASELEPEPSQPSDKSANDVLEQPADASQGASEADGETATPGSTPQTHSQPQQDSTEGCYAYGAHAAAAGQEAASQASNLSGIFRPQTPSAAQEQRNPQPSSQPTHPESTSEDQSAIDSLQSAVLALGRAVYLRAQLEALSAALEQAKDHQQAKRRAISRYEWMHEAILGPAGVLGPPIHLPHLVHTPLLHPPRSLQPSIDLQILLLAALQ